MVEVHILNLVTYMSIMMIGLMIATAVTFVTVGITIVHCIIACVIFLLLCLFSSDFSTNTSPRWTTCEMRKRFQEDTEPQGNVRDLKTTIASNIVKATEVTCHKISNHSVNLR